MKKVLVLIFVLVFGVVLVGCNPAEKEDHVIKVYTRDTTSGTRDGFFSSIGFGDAVKSNDPLVEGVIQVGGNGEIITGVKGDEYGIGYISLSSLDGSGLTALKYNGVTPSIDTVNDDTYKLTRPFNYVVRTGDDSDATKLAEAFVAYMGTKEGKTVIQSADGIVEVKDTDPTWASIKADYPVIEKDNSGVTVNFGGSTSVEKVSKALSAAFSPLAGNFVAAHNHTGSGDAWKRVQGGEKDGANALHIGFASRGFKTDGSEDMAEGTFGRLCTDAIVVVVNKANKTLSDISAEMLVKIYNGTVTKWSELE